jgi:hypothetical protein
VKSRRRLVWPVLLLALSAFILVSCTSEEEVWGTVQKSNSLNRYLEFLSKYHGSAHAVEAEQLAWECVKRDGTSSAYELYLKSVKGSRHESEAKNALSEIVLLPYMGYQGSEADMPSLEKLRVPEDNMSAPAEEILNNPSFHMNGTFPGLYINGKYVAMSDTKDNYDGREIATQSFGRIRCTFALGQQGNTSYMLFFYLGCSPKQRDDILAFVRSEPS